MPEELTGNARVEYSVREILDKQTDLLLRIDTKVDAKADKADVVALGHRLDGHAERIDRLEEHRLETDQVRTFRRRAWAVAGTVGGIAAVLAGSLIAAFVH